MKRIQRLHLRNFKAFRDQAFDFQGRHVLIYGGNGSGKSSIYWALYTLFEASGKTEEDVSKYFADPDSEAQSLRNVKAPASEPAYIKLDWEDPNPPLNPRTGKPSRGDSKGKFRLEAKAGKSNVYTNRSLREGNRSSDFVTYRLFQHFNGSNRHAVNVWPTFVRDIFPYYSIPNPLFKYPEGSDFEGEPLTFWEALGVVVDKFAAIALAREAAELAKQTALEASEAIQEKRRLAEEQGGEFGEVEEGELASPEAAERAQRTLDEAAIDFQNYLGNFNLELAKFVGRIAENTNNFLEHQAKLPGYAHKKIKLTLDYSATFRLNATLVQRLAAPGVKRDDWTSILRRDRPDELLVSLTAEMGNHTVKRPQTFLNEARLTQLAFALRMGALLDRNPNSRLNVLCLDDVLLSLDMGNRLEVLDWLFTAKVKLSGGSKESLLKHYQVFFLTHDQQLYELVKHYAKTRGNGADWYCAQLAWHSRTRTKQPLVLVEDDDKNNDLAHARIHFEAGDYGACGNYLRKVAEGYLEEFLPDEFARDSSGKFKLLDGLIQGLDKLYHLDSMELGAADYTPFADLMIYKKIPPEPVVSPHANTTCDAG